MSKALAELIDKPEQQVQLALKKIEDLNGNPSQDARLLAQNIQTLRAKLQDLSLDPNDTTGEELYQALRAKFAADSAHLDRALGVDEQTPIWQRINVTEKLLSKVGALPEVWALKHSATRQVLRGVPPTRLMKNLKYRSLASFIKHEEPETAYLLASAVESKTWQAKAAKDIAHLSAVDYEMRQLNIISLSQKQWQNNSLPKVIISDKQVGAVAFNPAKIPGNATVLSLAIEMTSQIELASGKDLNYKFGELSPVLRWWSDNQTLISRHEDGAVSLNVRDIAKDSLLAREYSQRTCKQARTGLLTSLAQSYENQSEKVSEAFKSIGYGLLGDTSKAPGQSLALEYAEAE